MNKNAKTLLVFLVLAAYLAVLLKLFVFKGLSIGVFGLRYHVAPARVPVVVHNNYIPFKTILHYLGGYTGSGVALSNLVGNIIPFMPLGFLLPLGYRSISWKLVTGITAAISLSIEILQLVLQVGTFDVDDLLLNTLGGVLGYLVFLLFAKKIRSVRQMGSSLP